MIGFVHAKVRSAANRVLRPADVVYRQHQAVVKSPVCQGCGGKTSLQGHHILPYHIYPEVGAHPDNFIVLCEAYGKLCHLYIGHGGSFRCWNPDVVEDAKRAYAARSTGERDQILREIKSRRRS